MAADNDGITGAVRLMEVRMTKNLTAAIANVLFCWTVPMWALYERDEKWTQEKR